MKNNEFFQVVLAYLDKIPIRRGCYYMDEKDKKNWEQGVFISYKNFRGNFCPLEHTLDILIVNGYPYSIKREAQKTFKEQIQDLLKKQEITPESYILFEYIDFKENAYNFSFELQFQVKDLLPYF